MSVLWQAKGVTFFQTLCGSFSFTGASVFAVLGLISNQCVWMEGMSFKWRIFCWVGLTPWLSECRCS